MHYQRIRNGGCLDISVAKKGSPVAFLESIKSTSETKCISWPFGMHSTGYGQVNLDGVGRNASNAICRLANGDPPNGKPHAAHYCGNRACVNPNHIRWTTVKENSADSRSHGTLAKGERNGHAKLTEREVVEIKKLIDAGTCSTREIGEIYSISRQAIRDIASERSWKHVDIDRMVAVA